MGFDHLGQFLAQLRAIVMTVNCNGMLHCRVYQFLSVSAEIATVQFISLGHSRQSTIILGHDGLPLSMMLEHSPF